MITARFDPPSSGKLSHVECVAAAARAAWAMNQQSPTWSELNEQADQKQEAALVAQSEYMRAVRPVIDKYERHCAGIRHRNPLSNRERQSVVNIWLDDRAPDTHARGIELCAKKWILSDNAEAMAALIVEVFDKALRQSREAMDAESEQPVRLRG